MNFDFKKYHIRAMNAGSQEEKEAINLELKEYYAELSKEEQKQFNEELQSFLINELAKIKSLYDSAS